MVLIGQYVAHLHRKGGLGKDQERAAERQAAGGETRTGTAHGRWTGNVTTASSPTWSTPTAACPTSSRAC